MTRQFRIFLVFAIGIIVLFGCYILAISIRSDEMETGKQRVQFEEMWQTDMGNVQRKELLKCLQNAHRVYSRTWNMHCRRLGGNPGCPLPSYIASSLDRLYQDDRRDCFKTTVMERSGTRPSAPLQRTSR